MGAPCLWPHLNEVSVVINGFANSPRDQSAPNCGPGGLRHFFCAARRPSFAPIRAPWARHVYRRLSRKREKLRQERHVLPPMPLLRSFILSELWVL
jgi:hypothetical protein